MRIKALFFDLDGTLLNSSKQIPDSARRALRSCRKRGVKVFLASARSPRLGETLGWDADEFSLFDGGIYSNGGCVETAGTVRYAFIHHETVARCVATVQATPGIHLSLHTPGHGYAFNFPATPGLLEGWGIQRENLRPLDEATMAETAKMLVFRNELVGETQPLPSSLCEELQTVCDGKARLYITDQGATAQVTSMEVGKLAAIRSIQAQLHLQDDEIAVFGDDLNDLEMLSAYPVSIAMGNGAPEVRACAKHVTRANDEDGVAWANEHLLQISAA